MGRTGQRAEAPPVLIVDDDRGTLVALEAVLESLECRVVRASSGSDAVERCRAEDLAAIIMDVRMPGLDGYAAASFIRQDQRSSCTPILFMTGHDDVDVAELTRTFGNTGQVDSLRKPFDPDLLRSKVRWWLELFRKGEQVQQLERAMDTFRAQARTKDDVLAIVAHDLRGPLAAMRLSTTTLLGQTIDGAADPAYLTSVRRHVDRVHRNIERMAAIVDDLLDNARMESGALQLDFALHRFEDIVAQSIELLKPLADQKGIEVVAIGGDGTGPASFDRDRMLQVLSNLIGNALKFTPPGGKVDVATTATTETITVSVRDTGPGIAPDDISRVFQKYWQGLREPGQKGVGLGLAIAKEIVLAHAGRIWVESQVGEGSRFFFSFPRAR